MAAIESLSIKQIKHVLRAKCHQLEESTAKRIHAQLSTIVEKNALVSLCQENVAVAELDSLLASPYGNTTGAAPTPPTQTKAANSVPANNAGTGSTMSGTDYKRHINSHMGSPDQLRYSASCMRRDPAGFRRSNPEAAQYSDEQIFAMATNMEQMAADPEKLRMYKEQINKMSDADIERMQKMQRDASNTSGTGGLDGNIDRFMAALKSDPQNAKAILRSVPGDKITF